MMKSRIKVDWELPAHVRAFQSEASLKIYTNSIYVQSKDFFEFTNRQFSLVNQVHSNKVCQIYSNDHHLTCDAVFTYEPNVIVAVRTADCIPVLLSNKKGSFVAAIHCGWRGIAKNILKKTIKKINSKDYIAWIGPGISQAFFTTDRDVFDAFMVLDNRLTKYFKYTNSKFYVNLFGVVEFLLKKDGVDLIYGNSITQDFCTFRDDKYFFSYRRDQTPYRLISAACIKS